MSQVIELHVYAGGKDIIIKVYSAHWMFKFFPKKKAAITLGRSVFCRGEPNEGIIRHETRHVRQIAEIGLVKFYTLYLAYFMRELWKLKNFQKAYRAIPFEVEAYNSKVDV
jgi:hypothetical protein